MNGKGFFLFATLRTGGLRHYYHPWNENLVELLDSTYQKIQNATDLGYKKVLIAFAYEIGTAEIIPLLLFQGGDIPDSWRSIKKLYMKYFAKLLKNR